MTQRRKRVARFVYKGLGFPVELRHVRMVKFRDTWAPDVNLNDLSSDVFKRLATKPTRLSGNEVHFIRQRMGMTLQAFAKHFHVTHPAVMKWEGAYHEPAGMSWGTEMSIRLKILKDTGSKPAQFFDAHSELEALELDAEAVGSLVMAVDFRHRIPKTEKALSRQGGYETAAHSKRN